MSASTHRSIGGALGIEPDVFGRLGRLSERLTRRVSARLADWLLLYLACRYLGLGWTIALTLIYLSYSVYRYEGVTFIQRQFGVRLVNGEGEPAFVSQALLRQAVAMFSVLWLDHTITWGNTIVWLLVLANVLVALGRSHRVLLDHLLNTEVYVMSSPLIIRREVDLAKLVTAPLYRRGAALWLDGLVVYAMWLAAGWWGVFVSPVLLVWSLYRHEGRTIGHRICRLQIVDLEGQPLTFRRALARQFIYKHLLSGLTFGTSMWVSVLLARYGRGKEQRRTIQDYGAHSWVVTTKSLTEATKPTTQPTN